MAKRKQTEIPKPLITRRCAKCNRWFVACHPKDPQEYCEKCRKEKK